MQRNVQKLLLAYLTSACSGFPVNCPWNLCCGSGYGRIWVLESDLCKKTQNQNFKNCYILSLKSLKTSKKGTILVRKKSDLVQIFSSGLDPDPVKCTMVIPGCIWSECGFDLSAEYCSGSVLSYNSGTESRSWSNTWIRIHSPGFYPAHR